jgi:hypothetical protein
MLWATLAFLIIVLSHGSSVGPFAKALEGAETRIEKAVQDSTRRDRALAIVKKAKGILEEHGKTERSTWKEVAELMKSRGTTHGNLDNALAPLQQDASSAETKILDLRFQLVGVLTRDEWHAVFPLPPAPPK